MSNVNYTKINVHHSAATTTGTGTDADVNGTNQIAVSITGTATSSTVAFLVSVDNSNFYAIQGVRLSDFTTASSTTTKGEIWQFDVTGVQTFRASITAISGGNLTIISNCES